MTPPTNHPGVQPLSEEKVKLVEQTMFQVFAEQILKSLPPDVINNMVEAQRSGKLEEMLLSAIQRAGVQASAVRHFTTKLVDLIEPMASALESPGGHRIRHRILTDATGSTLSHSTTPAGVR